MPLYPVNFATLRSARELRNMSTEMAAALLEMEVVTLTALEAGEQQPTLGQLRKMAQKYQLPLATLAHPDPLPPQERVTDFRTIGGAPAILSLGVSVAIDEARLLQRLAGELIEDGPELNQWPALPIATRNDDPVALARQERARLGFRPAVQLNTRDAADAFNYLRARIENLGIFVYMAKMRTRDCRGFFLAGDDHEPPVTGVNDDEPVAEAKIFTLVHEYCHVLLRAPGVSGHNVRRNPTERFCNRFAASFLMPAELLEMVLPLRRGAVEWDREIISTAARRLRVSKQALVLRLEEMGQAPRGFYARWMDRYGADEPPEPPRGGPSPWEPCASPSRHRLRRTGAQRPEPGRYRAVGGLSARQGQARKNTEIERGVGRPSPASKCDRCLTDILYI